MEKKCIVLLSGGLDSRLAVKIMQEQGFEVLALMFKLPFGCSHEEDIKNFARENKFALKIFDCSRGELLQEYLECIRKPKYGRGTGVNPCVDCKIFIFNKARVFADEKKINLIVSGEVLGERPMSQLRKSMNLVEEKSGLKGRLLRPLSAKLLEETEFEKNDLVNREKLYEIQGRKRDKQIALAKKFGIDYPEPSGGCLLCEKSLKNRFRFFIKKGISDEEIELIKIGRHFIIDNSWIILGRNENENKIIEEVGATPRAYPDKSSSKISTKGRFGKLFVSENPGPSAIIAGEMNNNFLELIKAYSNSGNLEDRKKFEKWRL